MEGCLRRTLILLSHDKVDYSSYSWLPEDPVFHSNWLAMDYRFRETRTHERRNWNISRHTITWIHIVNGNISKLDTYRSIGLKIDNPDSIRIQKIIYFSFHFAKCKKIIDERRFKIKRNHSFDDYYLK